MTDDNLTEKQDQEDLLKTIRENHGLLYFGYFFFGILAALALWLQDWSLIYLSITFGVVALTITYVQYDHATKKNSQEKTTNTKKEDKK